MIKGACAVIVGGLIWLSAGAANASSFEDGQAAYDNGNYSAAIEIWKPLAEQGDARSELMVGMAYGLGRGVPQSYAIAAVWYRRAADHGSTEAKVNLGAMYANGLGVREDYAEAINWWRQAVE